MPEIICRICGNKFMHDNPNAEFCFDCATDEIMRLRDQERIIEFKLATSPELGELLANLPTDQILARLKAKWYFEEYNPSTRGNTE